MTMALAPPPPLQIAAQPTRAPLARSTPMRREMMTAPVAPRGWPSATAPPWALTLRAARVDKARVGRGGEAGRGFG